MNLTAVSDDEFEAFSKINYKATSLATLVPQARFPI